MNKTELGKTLKITENELENLLKATGIPLDLEDYADRAKRMQEIVGIAKKEKIDYSEAISRSALSVSDRPLPQLVNTENQEAVDQAKSFIEGTELQSLIEEEASRRAEELAEAISFGPFDGIDDRAEEIEDIIDGSRRYGASILDEKVVARLNDPAFVSQMVATIRGKQSASK